MTERKTHGRKLLIASIGVAAVSYVACGGSTSETSGNLMAPDASATGAGGSTHTGGSANTGGGGTGGSANTGGGGTGGSVNTAGSLVGNLIAPPPPEAGVDTGAIQDAAVEKP